jgi:hypothetical protein
MRFSTAFAWLLWVGFCSTLCAGLFAGCLNDPGFVWPHLAVPGSTWAEKNKNLETEAEVFNPYPDPNISRTDPGETPPGFEFPRDPVLILRERHDLQQAAAVGPGPAPQNIPMATPIPVTPQLPPPAGTTLTAPYPAAPYATAPSPTTTAVPGAISYPSAYPPVIPSNSQSGGSAVYPLGSPTPYPGATPNLAPAPGPAPYVIP